MATVYFAPTATDASATASYWSSPDGTANNALPSAGDTLIFFSGTSAITAGHSALAAIDLAAVKVLPTCFKSCDTPLQLMVSHSGGPGELIYQGSAPVFKVMADGDGIDSAEIECNGGRFELSSDSTSTTAKLVTTRGNVRVAASARVTNWLNHGADLEIVDSANTYTTGTNRRGELKDYRGGATLNVVGGTAMPMLDAAYSTAVNAYGGTFNPRTTGTIAKLNGFGGLIHPTNSPSDVTITNADFYEGVRVFEKAAGSSLVFSNTPVYFGNVALQSTSKGVGTGTTGGDTGFGSGA